MTNLVDFLEEFLSQKNVYVISEIVREIKKYTRPLKKSVTHKISSHTFAPISKLEKIIDENNSRLTESGIENDPLIDRIYNLLPSKITSPNGYINSPSHTDKLLIATPLAAGFTDGRDKIVISNDSDLRLSLLELRKAFEKNPRALYLDDLGHNFKKFVLTVCSFERNSGEPFLRHRIKFTSNIFLHQYYGAAS